MEDTEAIHFQPKANITIIISNLSNQVLCIAKIKTQETYARLYESHFWNSLCPAFSIVKQKRRGQEKSEDRKKTLFNRPFGWYSLACHNHSNWKRRSRRAKQSTNIIKQTQHQHSTLWWPLCSSIPPLSVAVIMSQWTLPRRLGCVESTVFFPSSFFLALPPLFHFID